MFQIFGLRRKILAIEKILNVVNPRSYGKINDAHLQKNRCCIYVIHNRQGYSSVSEL